jgi:tetratricopeptide (TPR) repeat protein
MDIGRISFAAALAAFAIPAGAAVIVVGTSSARMCFEAADAQIAPSRDSLLHCDDAMNENLSPYELVATFVNRGIVKLRMGQIGASIADFDAALSRDPNQAEAYLDKGMALLHQSGGWQAAVPMFDSALTKGTKRPEIAYYGRGVANELGGRIESAYRDYRQASEIAPKWRDPQVELARFTVRPGRRAPG